MINVVVVDDQRMIRDAVAELVTHEADLRLVGVGVDGFEAVRLAAVRKPDVVVMDVRMPLLDGIEATRMITQDAALATVRVLILTTFEDDPEFVVRGVQAGASGFVGKGAQPGVLVDAIRTVHQGDGLLSPRATKNLIDRYAGHAGPSETHPDLRMLTDRELSILRLVAQGLTNQEIAQHLSISTATVKTHINRTMTKVGRHERAQLVVLAYSTGLVLPRYH